MHPIERLRYVARAGDVDPGTLAQEAADALGSLASDPRALVPACRRLIEFHPSCAPLWWVCARLLVASDVREAADVAAGLLYDDHTDEELAAHFPAGATVVSAGGPIAIAGLSGRPDLTIRLVGRPSTLRYGMRRIDGDVTGYDTAEADEACSGATLALVEPFVAGPSGVLVSDQGGEVAAAAARSGLDLWVVLGEGRLLPAALFEALRQQVDACGVETADDEELFDLMPTATTRRGARFANAVQATVLPSTSIAAVIGPTGGAQARVALAHPTCGAPTELLEPSRGM